jgi:hypothetical protein
VDPVAAGSNSSDASYTRTITIVFGIIGAVLTLFTVVVAILQYRLQKQRRTDVGRDDDGIGMSSQCSVSEEGALSTPPPYVILLSIVKNRLLTKHCRLSRRPEAPMTHA